VTPALVVLLVGVALLVLVTVRAVPAQPVPVVTAADVDRDFTAAEQARERAFRRGVRPWGLAATALGVLVPSVLVLVGAVAAAARATAGPWWAGVVSASTVVLVVTRAATLPGAVVVRRRSLEAGLATGSWARWARDLGVALALGWVLTTVALVGWLAAVRAWPESWWVVLAPVAAVLVVVLSFLVPVVVEPLFARLTRMPEGALRSELLDLAARDGVAVRDVLVADASRRTTALNAYVSGLGSTRRVVVHDTLLDRDRDDEVRAVVAHELGHVVAHDVRTGTLLGAVGAALAVVAAAVALSWSWVLGIGHASSAADPAVAGLLIAGGAWAGLLGAPLQNAVSRRVERRADAHCLDLARDPATVAAMHRALAVTNLGALRPPRLLHLWFGTHPTSPERIAAVRAWGRVHGGVVIPGLASGDDPSPGASSGA
jgi:STE24 endopeptidase